MARGKGKAPAKQSSLRAAGLLPTLKKPAEAIGLVIHTPGELWEGCAAADRKKLYKCNTRVRGGAQVAGQPAAWGLGLLSRCRRWASSAPAAWSLAFCLWRGVLYRLLVAIPRVLLCGQSGQAAWRHAGRVVILSRAMARFLWKPLICSTRPHQDSDGRSSPSERWRSLQLHEAYARARHAGLLHLGARPEGKKCQSVAPDLPEYEPTGTCFDAVVASLDAMGAKPPVPPAATAETTVAPRQQSHSTASPARIIATVRATAPDTIDVVGCATPVKNLGRDSWGLIGTTAVTLPNCAWEDTT